MQVKTSPKKVAFAWNVCQRNTEGEMAELDKFEGTWEELMTHADELRGKTLRLTIISNTAPAGEGTKAVQPKNLAEFLGDFIGSVEGNGENNSDDTGEKFTQYLVKKHAEGHL